MATASKFSLKPKCRDSYLELVQQFPLASIQSDEHLQEAQLVVEELLTTRLDDGATMYLEALSDLIASYEDEHYPIEPASDAEMLQHLLEAKQTTQAAVSRATGIPKSMLSEVLSGKRPFSRPMMRKLAEHFHVDVGVLAGNI